MITMEVGAHFMKKGKTHSTRHWWNTSVLQSKLNEYSKPNILFTTLLSLWEPGLFKSACKNLFINVRQPITLENVSNSQKPLLRQVLRGLKGTVGFSKSSNRFPSNSFPIYFGVWNDWNPAVGHQRRWESNVIRLCFRETWNCVF